MRQAAQPAAVSASGRRIIERPRLLKLLDETAARTILLIAPAGYGKTTFARQWAERQTDVHWYTARTGSADVAQLAVDLAEVFDQTAERLADYVRQLVRALPNPSQSAAQIAQGIAAVTPDLAAQTLFIDDWHLIAEDASASVFVRELQSRVGVRLLISSRTRPVWATARLQMYGELLEVGAEELALTESEALEVLGRPPSQAETILRGARGWPAVVGLAAQTQSDISSDTDAAATTLFRFIAEELFQAMPAILQEDLLTLALLPKLTRRLVEIALRRDMDAIGDELTKTGLATSGQDGLELHPLVREYLLAKLAAERDAAARVDAAVKLALREGYWDHAFEMVTRFKAMDLLDELIETTFTPLVASGRIATAEQIANFAHAASHVSPLVDLIDAEVAFRHGLFARAEVAAARAAKALGGAHPLTSHAWWIAGQGAQLSLDDAKALSHFDNARDAALSEDDLRDALWGAALTSCQSEDASAPNVVQPLLSRRDQSAIDRVRATAAEILLERIVGSGRAIDLTDALHALDSVSDPRVRTSSLNAFVYYLILRGRYDEASDVAGQMRETADAYQLTWAQPHAHWALAAVALGRRRIAESNTWLRRVERSADEGRFGPLLLNASCLRARQLLALGQPKAAWSALTVDETLPANRGMRGEYFATKALALAVLGETTESTAWAQRARAVTCCVEAHAYAACADSISALHGRQPPERIVNLTSKLEDAAMWDALISSLRAWPPLLAAIIAVRPASPGLVAALRNAYDFDLSRSAGVDIGRRPRPANLIGILSPRELEVLDLVRRGLTNQEIASSLFISKATVKVHVRHILEKTGARSRTEAATLLTSIEQQRERG